MGKARAGRLASNADGRIRARNEAAILKAATLLFSKKGYEGTSIAEIAAAAGLPKANVYYYFADKEAIYQAIIRDLIAQWDDALAAIAADREPGEAIADYVRAKLDFSRRHGAESKIFANEIIRGGSFLTRQDRAHIHAITTEKTEVFEGWAVAGKMDRVDFVHFFVMLWASTQYYAEFDVMARNALQRKRLTKRDFDRAAETITDIVLKGCGVAPPRGRGRSPGKPD